MNESQNEMKAAWKKYETPPPPFQALRESHVPIKAEVLTSANANRFSTHHFRRIAFFASSPPKKKRNTIFPYAKVKVQSLAGACCVNSNWPLQKLLPPLTPNFQNSLFLFSDSFCEQTLEFVQDLFGEARQLEVAVLENEMKMHFCFDQKRKGGIRQ